MTVWTILNLLCIFGKLKTEHQMVHCHGIWTLMGLWAFDPFNKHQIGIGFDFQNQFGNGTF